MSKLALIASISIFAALLVRFLIERLLENTWDSYSHSKEIINFIIIGITVIVVFIP